MKHLSNENSYKQPQEDKFFRGLFGYFFRRIDNLHTVGT